MAANISAVLHPDRGIFVARDVEDEEAVGLRVISGERRYMAASLLSYSLAQIVDDHEMAGLPKISARQLAELVDRTIGGVMNFRFDRLRAENPADLIERHALVRKQGDPPSPGQATTRA